MSSKLNSTSTLEDRAQDFVINVTNLGKMYQIYSRPQDRFKQSVFPRFQRLMGRQPVQYFDDFWALRDLSFTINKGETVGVIGRNGAGKSTLLQLICGTLAPSVGAIETRGRIAALLELGSGFNPEFTGRENVYLSATILGLNKDEIDAKFDAITEFANIGDFINQPVRIYSSGMFVRLAFAVIAHVDADILIIDEALSVGDAIFTQKCMRFIRSFQKHGTLLFVSHDIASVQNLCEKSIWLDSGKVKRFGDSKTVAEEYLQDTLQATCDDGIILETIATSAKKNNEVNLPTTTHFDESDMSVQDNLMDASGWKTGDAEILRVKFEHINATENNIFKGGEEVRVVIEAIVHKSLDSPILGFVVKDRLGQELFGENTLTFTSVHKIIASAGQHLLGEFDFLLPSLPNGEYVVMAAIADGDLYKNTQHHFLHDACLITVSSSLVQYGLVGLQCKKTCLRVSDAE